MEKELIQSIKTGLIDFTLGSSEELQPKLLINDYKKGTKVLGHIINELENCDGFLFSVAFITESGLTILLNTLKSLETKGIKGQILTTDYLNFTSPKALRRLLAFKNIELKMYTKGNFHTKGYLFKKSKEYTLIIGSSNLTQSALTSNQEWNIKISSLDNGKLLMATNEEFNKMWSDAESITIQLLEEYELLYKEQHSQSFVNVGLHKQTHVIEPNKMQIEAMNSLNNLRLAGETKALLISATGTGKTYLSAFDVMQYNPKRFLFIVHRENIANQAMESFKYLIKNKHYGLLTGNVKDFEASYLFTTIQTLSKDHVLQTFNPDHFDYIVVDEVHRSGASSYIKVLNYFKPSFLLGMTATPERSDGFDIFKHFDYNIAHEVRLQEALEEDLLCPFHYFGVSDIEIEGVMLDENSDFTKLTSDERLKHIIDTIDFYGYYGDYAKGLIFCSRVEEAKELSYKFNSLGYKTTYLSGSDPENKRTRTIEQLESDFEKDRLDYIFTVDIFNEGIDIPKINQIIMLRPTQSAIIFVQQLGRGLRKCDDKEFVTVIDFIGNYQNNFLIPVALSGDKSLNKDNLRRFIREGNNIIPGCSTISFDEISKKRIYENINQTSFKKLNLLKLEYLNLKNKIGRIPTFMDFYKYGAIDPQLILNYSKTYFNFLCKVENEFNSNLNSVEINLLEFISNELMPTKRIHEIELISELLKNGLTTLIDIETILSKTYNIKDDSNSVQSAINYFKLDFLTSPEQVKYNQMIHLEHKNIILNKNLYSAYHENTLFYSLLNDLLEYGRTIYNSQYLPDKCSHSNFALYKKYTRKEVCNILNWDKNLSSVVYGYMIKGDTCPIFVTYEKNIDIQESINYQDEFINRNIFSWMTRNRIRIDSKETVLIRNAMKTGLKIHLFIKKADDEGTEHYYMGEMNPVDAIETTISNNNGMQVPIVNFKFKLNYSVREDIFDYIIK